MTYQEWQRRFPEAAEAFKQVIAATPWNDRDESEGKSEAWAQQQVRLSAGHQGAYAWRNNVGAIATKEPTQCPSCGFHFDIKRPPLRYGLANDSAKLNKHMKSSDVILCIPRIIQPQHVGLKFAQFGAVECKHPGWQYKPTNAHDGAQAAFLQLVLDAGGFATFSTGGLQL